MRIVLRADIDKVGKRGDIVEVADGFARNYLIPRGEALLATRGIAAQAAAMRASRDRTDAKNRSAAEEIARRLVAVTLRMDVRAGAEGKLFGSVSSGDLIAELQRQADISVERKQLDLREPLKTVGAHAVPVRLHPDVQVVLNVELNASEE